MADIRDKISRIDAALDRLAGFEENCRLCPRECGADRKNGQRGYCGGGNRAVLSHALLHFGEEPVLSGMEDCRTMDNKRFPEKKAGSGALFFSGCHLKCLFCQNHQISWEHRGRPVGVNELAEEMLRLQEQGALNINLVSPTHMILPVLQALKTALVRGLDLAIVFNSSGYEKEETIRLLDGIIDIYLPDFKYACSVLSARLSGAPDYFEHARRAISEMARQQPVLETAEDGSARRGLIIRHLILPGYLENSFKVLEWTAKNLSNDIPLSLMSQYFPCFKAPPEMQRRLYGEEYQKVLDLALELGFTDIFIQPEVETDGRPLIPDFSQKNPFRWSGI